MRQRLLPWLFEASYDAVGDLAETISLVLPPPAQATIDALAMGRRRARAARRPAVGEVRMRPRARVAAARRRCALRVHQARHRRVSRRRREAARLSRALAQTLRRRRRRRRAAPRRRLDAGALRFATTCAARPRCSQHRGASALSVLSRPRAGDAIPRRSAIRGSGRPNGSGTASARSCWSADDGASVWSRGEELVSDSVSRTRRRCARIARRDRHRRRDPDGWAAQPMTPLPFASLAAAAQSQAPGAQAAARHPGRARRLRPARARRTSTSRDVPLVQRRALLTTLLPRRRR